MRVRHRDDDRERRSIIILKVVQLDDGSNGFRVERADATITTHNLRTCRVQRIHNWHNIHHGWVAIFTLYYHCHHHRRHYYYYYYIFNHKFYYINEINVPADDAPSLFVRTRFYAQAICQNNVLNKFTNTIILTVDKVLFCTLVILYITAGIARVFVCVLIYTGIMWNDYFHIVILALPL